MHGEDGACQVAGDGIGRLVDLRRPVARRRCKADGSSKAAPVEGRRQKQTYSENPVAEAERDPPCAEAPNCRVALGGTLPPPWPALAPAPPSQSVCCCF